MIPPAAGFVHRYEPGRGDRRTLLALHGTGGDENDLIEVARALAPRAAVLSPRGPVLENGAPRFFRRLAAGVFDEADVAARARDLARFVRESADQRGFDPARVVAVGYSNGANIAAAVMLLEPLTLLGGVLFRAMPPLTPREPPDLSHLAVHLAAGRRDPYGVHAPALAQLLARHGARVDFAWTDAGHELTAADVERAQSWLASGPLAG